MKNISQAVEFLENWLNLLDRALPLEMVDYNSEDARKALMVIKQVMKLEGEND